MSRRRALAMLGGLTCALAGRVGVARERRPREALVVGAGIAGLSAAYVLKRGGFDVRVFESTDAIGGRMRDAWTGPLYGPVHAAGVFDDNDAMFALARELGVVDALQGPEVSYPIDNGRGVHSMGLRLRLAEAAQIPGLSAAARAALEPFGRDFMQRFSDVDPCRLATGAGLEDLPIPDYLRRFAAAPVARELVDEAIAPVVEGWGTPIDEASTVAFFASFARQRARFVHPAGSIGTLPLALAARVAVHTSTTVMRIGVPDAQGRRAVRYLDDGGRVRVTTPDVVVVAVPAPIARTLVDALDPVVDGVFRQVEYSKYAMVEYVLSPEAAPRAATMMRFTTTHPDALKRRVAVWAALPASSTPRAQPATAAIGLSLDETFRWQATNRPLHEYAFPLLQALYPALAWQHVTDVVVKGGDYVPYLRVGFAGRAQTVLERQARARGSLYFVGEALAGAHTGASCASGVTVGEQILRHWTGDAA